MKKKLNEQRHSIILDGSVLQEILVFSNCGHTAVTNVSTKVAGGASTKRKGVTLELSPP
jgi:hypothetical protein